MGVDVTTKLLRISWRIIFYQGAPQWTGLLHKEMATGAQQKSTTYYNIYDVLMLLCLKPDVNVCRINVRNNSSHGVSWSFEDPKKPTACATFAGGQNDCSQIQVQG